MPVEKIAIKGLDQFAAASLLDELKEHGIDAEITEQPSKVFGEPISVAVIIAIAVGAPLAIGIAAWLMKGRQQDKLDFSMDVIHTDGTIEHQEFHWDGKVENETDPKLIEALGKALPKLDPLEG
jgi:hypothetical protein